jgi:phosphatidylserine/phosphatidylglycerophosphate/cardiolipin synthase-like enzyme
VGDVSVFNEVGGFRVKLWRGESACLLGFDVDEPEDDFVGFAVEFRYPGATDFQNLSNRLSFGSSAAVDGFRNFPTLEAPLQTFRWVHFPWESKIGQSDIYTYRVTKMHMPADNTLTKGLSIELPIELGPVTVPGFLDVGFTRNFASSQAFEDKKDRFGFDNDIIPAKPAQGLQFADHKAEVTKKFDIYAWLGFEAYRLLFDFLDWAINDPTVRIDAMAYDFNEPDVLARLEALGERLRIIIDDSKDHRGAHSAESQAAQRLIASAGQNNVRRGHFEKLQHNKVLIARRRSDGAPLRVLGGSTNFSFRGLYIQANNMYVFTDTDVAALFAGMFDQAFGEAPDDMADFSQQPIASKWHAVKKSGQPMVKVCFSPHKSSELSLAPVGGAIQQATSSVFYSFAFMNQITSGPVREALDNLMKRPVFSYGIVNKAGGMEIHKPDGEIGLVDFAYLSKHAPEPFKSEWSGGPGINIHNKFVVVDFDQPGAKVYTGSSNFAPAGEEGNGDHLISIEDQRVAVAYAIDALTLFDHLNFRDRMKQADEQQPKPAAAKRQTLQLQKPVAISGAGQPWFAKFYDKGSQRELDRITFSRR